MIELIYGVVDMGSNTMRLSIYECANAEVKPLLSKKEMAGLSGYVQDGTLTNKGVAVACEILNSFKAIVDNFSIEHLCVFATASLRNVSNTEQAVKKIKEATGISVDVLSGEEEARLDFVGATHALEMESGMLIDIGGGSTEIVTFKAKRQISGTSVPIGSLNLYYRNVQRFIPKAKEVKAIRLEVEEKLEDCFPEEKTYRTVCGVGGTVRAAVKLSNELFGPGPQGREITVKNLGRMIEMAKKNDAEMIEEILKVTPDRIHTILPGMIVLQTAAKKVRAKTIVVSSFGVREGYLYDRVMKPQGRC